MAISELVTAFRGKFNTYTPVVNLLEDSSDATKPTAQKGTNGAAHTNPNLFAGEDEANDVQVTEHGRFNGFSVARTTSDAQIGATGAAGDYLDRVLVTATIGAADLLIDDGAGTTVALIPAATAVGVIVEVGCLAGAGGFVVKLHATAVGTVTCIGRFT